MTTFFELMAVCSFASGWAWDYRGIRFMYWTLACVFAAAAWWLS
jgi:hypothetical protein